MRIALNVRIQPLALPAILETELKVTQLARHALKASLDGSGLALTVQITQNAQVNAGFWNLALLNVKISSILLH